MIISWPHFSHIFSWIRRKKYELNVCSFIPLSLNGPSLIISPAHDPGSLKFYENFRLHFYHLSELRLLRRHIIAAAEENFAEKAFCGRTESDGAEKVTLPTAHLLTCVCMYVYAFGQIMPTSRCSLICATLAGMIRNALDLRGKGESLNRRR